MHESSRGAVPHLLHSVLLRTCKLQLWTQQVSRSSVTPFTSWNLFCGNLKYFSISFPQTEPKPLRIAKCVSKGHRVTQRCLSPPPRTFSQVQLLGAGYILLQNLTKHIYSMEIKQDTQVFYPRQIAFCCHFKERTSGFLYKIRAQILPMDSVTHNL